MGYLKALVFAICSSLFCLPLFAGQTQAYLIFTSEMPEVATGKGDYPELATLLKQYRAGDIPVFFLFGGASLGPSMLSSFDYGSHIIDILNTLEPDVMAVANREFSYFEDELSLRAYEAAFPVVASNLWDPVTESNLDGLVRYVVLQQGNFRIGVISVVDPVIAEQYALERVKITEPVNAIREQASILRLQGVDAVALLYSSALPELPQLLGAGVIDLSFRKDDHFLLTNTHVVALHPHNVFLPKPGLVAIVKLQKSPDLPVQAETQVVSLTQYEKEPVIQQQVQDYMRRLNQLMEHPLGVTSVAMDTRRREIRTQENAFASYVADVLRQRSGAEVALLNSGFFRGEQLYAAGSVITRRHLAREFPFRNSVTVVTVTGQQLWDALESGFSQYENIRGRFPQISGMQVIFNSDHPSGSRLLSVQVNGEPLQLNRHYRLATLDYLINGGDGYAAIKNSPQSPDSHSVDWLLSDMVIASIQKQETIAPVLDGRLINRGKL